MIPLLRKIPENAHPQMRSFFGAGLGLWFCCTLGRPGLGAKREEKPQMESIAQQERWQ